MKKITILLISLILFTSCNNELVENIEANQNFEFLLTRKFCDTCNYPSFEYSYNDNNKVETIIYNNDLLTTYELNYNESQRLIEVIQSPVNVSFSPNVVGYVKTNFTYISDNQFTGHFQYFDTADILIKEHDVDYIFEGDLIKSIKLYGSNNQIVEYEIKFFHDEENRLLYREYTNSLGNQNRYTNLSWNENSKPLSIGVGLAPTHSVLTFFPNKILSSKIAMTHKSEVIEDVNNIYEPTFYNSTYIYDQDNNPVNYKFFVEQDISPFLEVNYEYIQVN